MRSKVACSNAEQNEDAEIRARTFSGEGEGSGIRACARQEQREGAEVRVCSHSEQGDDECPEIRICTNQLAEENALSDPTPIKNVFIIRYDLIIAVSTSWFGLSEKNRCR